MSWMPPDLDRYLDDAAAHGDPVLLEMERLAERRRFPAVGPQVGRLLEVLCRAARARAILELGSGFGYSAYWLLRGAGPTGRAVLVEGDGGRALEAEAFLERGGFGGRFRIEVGRAIEVAARLDGPFDLIFNDVDKHEYPAALDAARRLLRPGGLFVTDNVLWSGRVLAPREGDRDTAGVLELTRRLREAPDFATAIVPIRDGVAIAVRTR